MLNQLQLRVLNEVYRRFRQTSEWPLMRLLDIELSDVPDVDVICASLPEGLLSYGSIESQTDRCVLRLRALQYCDDGDVMERAVLAAARLASTRYRASATGEAKLARSDLAAYADLDEITASQAMRLLHENTRVAGGATGSPPESLDLSPLAKRLAQVRSIDALVKESDEYSETRLKVSMGRNRGMSAQPESELIGSRWKLVRAIVKRGPAEVWIAEDTHGIHQVDCVLKRLRTGKSATSMSYQRFEREIQLTRELAPRAPGVVTVLDYGVSDGSWSSYYVMPFYRQTLEAAVVQFKGKFSRTLALGVQLAETLQVAHESGVVHRDIKPSNILLDDSLNPRIADFGIAFLMGDDEGRLTKSEAATVGSLDYAAPELSGGGQKLVDERVDIYSLGKTLYYALSGGKLFPRERFESEEYSLAAVIGETAQAHLEALLARMVTDSPHLRFSTMSECAQAFRDAIESVKRHLPYQPGYYGGSLSPRERFVALTHGISNSQADSERKDQLRDAIHDLGEAVTTSRRAFRRTKGLTLETEKAAATFAADQFLAIGLPLVTADTREAVTEWLKEMSEIINDTTSSSAARILSAGACAAYYGLLASANFQRRWLIMRLLLDEHDRDPEPFTYLGISRSSANTTHAWVSEALGQSQIIPLHSPRLANALSLRLRLARGFAFLSYLIVQYADYGAEVVDETLLPDLPGAREFSWIPDFAVMMRKSPAQESVISTEVFGRDAVTFRKLCRELTQYIEGAVRTNWKGRAVHWRTTIDPDDEWARWCGKPSS